MLHLTAHHLRFDLEVETRIELNEHKGAALRGLLFHALRGPARNPALGFCTQRYLRTCAECALVAACPVAGLVSTMNPEAERGRDVPRPYAIVPPLDGRTCYEPGERLGFGLTLFGNALNLFPYVVMGLRQAEPGGLGKKLPRPEAGGRAYRGTHRPARRDAGSPAMSRGRFRLRQAQAINLLTGEVQEVLAAGSSLVHRPALPVTHEQVVEASRQMLSRRLGSSANGSRPGAAPQRAERQGPVEITLTFLTPTRIVDNGRLLAEPQFGPLFHRLLDRLLALSREFAPAGEHVAHGSSRDATLGPEPGRGAADRDQPFDIAQDKPALLALADGVKLAGGQTRWQELWGYSARQERRLPLSGFTGQAVYRAPVEVWAELLPYLLWGSVVHVGKNAVKGDGIIAVSG